MEILSMGEKIRRRRKSLRLTLKDVAGDNVTPAQLSYIESDKCKPSNSLLKYICDKIDLNMDYVLESESQQAEKYCDYFLKEYEFYIKRCEFEEAEKKLANAEELSEEYDLFKHQGVIKYKKGLKLLEEGKTDNAQYYLLSALQIFMRLDDNGYIASCYNGLGVVALKRNYPEDALRLFKTAEQLTGYEISLDMIPRSKILFNLAKVYYEMGRKYECRRNIFKAIEEAEKEKDDLNRAELLTYGAYMLEGKEMLLKCDSYLDESSRIYKEKGFDDRKLILIHIIRAIVYINAGDEETAFEYCEDILQNIEGNVDQKTTYYLLKLCYYLIIRGYEKNAIIILDAAGDKIFNKGFNVIYNYLRSLCFKDVDEVLRKEYLIKCTEFLDETQSKDISIAISLSLGELYKQNNDYTNALEYLLEGARLISSKLV